jgi:6-pyruvoyltetrahydropterin/6-carboxytetrahydropterin synthase
LRIAKEFHWEMGHRLPEHFGLCKNIHGHSYKMILTVEGEMNQQQMVIDYYDLEKIISPIIQELDHAFMVNKDDKLVLEFLNQINSKKVVVDFDATVENICLFILNKIKTASLPKNIKAIAVRIYETQFDYAEERLEINQ